MIVTKEAYAESTSSSQKSAKSGRSQQAPARTHNSPSLTKSHSKAILHLSPFRMRLHILAVYPLLRSSSEQVVQVFLFPKDSVVPIQRRRTWIWNSWRERELGGIVGKEDNSFWVRYLWIGFKISFFKVDKLLGDLSATHTPPHAQPTASSPSPLSISFSIPTESSSRSDSSLLPPGTNLEFA